MRHLIALALLCSPAACLSQQGDQTVSPGMTEAQVVAALGKPATLRSAGGHKYMFYANSCGRQCGMNDLVILSGDSVVDAIFRSPGRHYTGTSSSPAPVPPSAAAGKKPAASPPLRIRPPATRTDLTPSVPVNPPTLKPAPATPAPTKKTTP
jgi:hypothetical protein